MYCLKISLALQLGLGYGMKTRDAGIVSRIRVPVDSFHESMDSYGFMVTNPDS